jgi:2-C-methyl-D-erythritol 4-phosphate cytidylyltransferase
LSFPLQTTVPLHGFIGGTVDRRRFWFAQTPQSFKKEVILSAMREADRAGYRGTDDASLVEMAGGKVAIVMGSYDNIKITTPIDIKLAENIISAQK